MKQYWEAFFKSYPEQVLVAAANTSAAPPLKFKVGDTVELLSGNYAGDTGKVVQVYQDGRTYAIIVDFLQLGPCACCEDELALRSQNGTFISVPAGAQLKFDDSAGWTISQDHAAQWKSEGRCQLCGELRPMSIWGLGHCPVHKEETPE